MSVDAFFMRFHAGDVARVPFATVRSILERFGTVKIEANAAVVTFHDGEVSDQMVVELDSDGTFEVLVLPRICRDEALKRLAFCLISSGGFCFFDESVEAIYASSDVTADVPSSLLEQSAQGVVVARSEQSIVW